MAMAGCGGGKGPGGGPVVIEYWEKWTGFEADAMRVIVDDFNRSQDGIQVNYLSVSQIDTKLLLATAGGNPPDVAGIWGLLIPVYAEHNALTPLDGMAREYGIAEEDYLPMVWDYCQHEGFLWALPTTPAVLALHWNKDAFREAGLDPERGPATLAELEEFNEKLMKRDAAGRLIRIGHTPQEPGWWNVFWPIWFGGELWRADGGFRADQPEMAEVFQWLGTYADRFGSRDLQRMRNGFGTFASPQNPFFTGRVAMVLQGPWMYNFIQDYAPAGFDWGVAPFPSAVPGVTGVTVGECDVLVIPAGAAHPREAFAFIAYVNERRQMERLCLGQKKSSPLREVSAEFYEQHPNPYLRVFSDLSAGDNVVRAPPVTVWTQYTEAMNNAVDLMMLGDRDTNALLIPLQSRIQQQHERKKARWERVRETRMEEWRRDVAQ
jgi:multiple sugar transport system substrate-binding protein